MDDKLEVLPETRPRPDGRNPAEENRELKSQALERTRVRLRNVMEEPLSRSTRFDSTRQNAYIDAILAGLVGYRASAVAGVHPTVVARYRREDHEFDQAVLDALAIAAEPVLERLEAIALDGDPAAMATVRAAEVYLKSKHPAYQSGSRAEQRMMGASLRMTKRENGDQVIEVSPSSLIPD